ncbi:thermonuclease family protein [Macrococcus armenti]|uniref:thermonuclease family protein n=1 Tax=Macrococcus armenti TaxID=2875764 RepID=UPI001CCE2B4C|nr:thermonuclease family protein [Macrococcus armenti]UBH16578.1 thermonuclease family protein [Macrococcus armenti]UBH21213.1 thermonuclease family protein [Macrococcus armenti]
MKWIYKISVIPVIIIVIGILFINTDTYNYQDILNKTLNKAEIKDKSNNRMEKRLPFQRERLEINVDYVIDGDTFISKNKKYRLILVDTPETKHPQLGVQPYGVEASNYTKNKLENKKVEIEYDIQKTDRYGRQLVYVWLEDKMYNAELIEKGYARVLTVAPNTRYLDKLKMLEIQAKKENKGLWNYEEYK